MNCPAAFFVCFLRAWRETYGLVDDDLLDAIVIYRARRLATNPFRGP